MNNPFQPRPTVAGGSGDNATSPSTGFMASTASNPSQPPLAATSSMSSMSGKSISGASISGASLSGKSIPEESKAKETPAKRGWFSKLFGRSQQEEEKEIVVPTTAVKESSLVAGKPTEKPKEVVVKKAVEKSIGKSAEKSADKDLMVKRHEDLLNSVNDICKSLETSRAQKVEVSVVDLVPPLPVENIDALTRTQEAVTGVLEKVSGRLDKVGERDVLVIDSLNKVDGSLLSLSKVGERSITSMDGVKGTLGQVNGAMETMQVELKRTGKRYEELCEKVQNSERDHAETMVKLQKRTLLMNAFLGIALVACVIAVVVAAAA
ncbi:hypothetical protein V2O64_01625 [Verrucomicrobiaceae bacterium 227]